MKCFYHKIDFDGQCSAAIVYYKHPRCELIPINYGDPFPWERIKKDETIFMVDFALQPFSDMLKLQDIVGIPNLHWIDHHKSAIEEYNKVVATDPSRKMLGLRVDGKGACELTWEYMFPREKMPVGVKYLGRFDVWDHRDKNAVFFQYGLKLYNTSPKAGIWKAIFHSRTFIYDTLEKGQVLQTYQNSQYRRYAEAYAFVTDFEGRKCLACNRGQTGSFLFDSVWDPTKYDMMIAFCHLPGGPKRWTVSLYTTKDDVDCSAIAAKYGGGGHKKAAGFQCDTLPFSSRVRVNEVCGNQ